MTKKHFRALAQGFYYNKPDNADAYTQWVIDIKLIADVCAQANPNFNREKFLTACREGL